MGIEAKLGHKQDRGNEVNMRDKNMLHKGPVAPPTLTLKVGFSKEVCACNFRVKFVHTKYESLPNLGSIGHRMTLHETA